MQNRIDGCFQRCLNGNKSVVNTKVGIAVESYITWLSTGMNINMSSKAPRTPLKIKIKIWSENRKKFKKLFKKVTFKNYQNGKKLYIAKCSSCHGKDGSGNGSFPPLWGEKSYTADGSMAKLPNAATWIQDNMPIGKTKNLSDSEVVDITLYINTHNRPSYKGFQVEDNFKKLGLDLKKLTKK